MVKNRVSSKISCEFRFPRLYSAVSLSYYLDRNLYIIYQENIPLNIQTKGVLPMDKPVPEPCHDGPSDRQEMYVIP
jgi:hypothetical protein